MTALERYLEAGRLAGCARQQMENFVCADVILQPRQLAASAAARLCDRADGPTAIGYGGARGGGKSHWLRRSAELTRAGVRRQLHVDVVGAEDIRPEIAATVADIAALSEDKWRVALAETGLLAPHWPKPYGRAATPAEQLVIDQELAAVGCSER